MIGCGGLGFCVFFFSSAHVLPSSTRPATAIASFASLTLTITRIWPRHIAFSFTVFFFFIGRHFSSSLIAFPSTSLSLAQGCADLPSSSLPLISLSTSLFIHAMHLRWSAPRSVAFGSFGSFLSFLFFCFRIAKLR